jgi:hypothetical protein
MKGPRGRCVLVVMLVVACAWVWTRSAASVPARSAAGALLAPTAVLRVNTGRPGDDFEVGAVGLSTETSQLTMGRLSATNYHLVRLMRLLEPSVLRIGANSVDFSWWTSSNKPPPTWATNTVTPADLRVLRGLLSTTGWRVLLGVDFGHFEPMRAAEEARYAREILGSYLLGVEIGNEPDEYSHAKGQGKVDLRPPAYDVSEYLREAEAYRQALSAATPGVAIYGPALSKIQWLTQMGVTARMFTEITQHYYPTTTCTAASLSQAASPSEPPPTVEGLLSPALRQQENDFLETIAQVGTIAGRPTRIGETNSISYCSESTPGSPSFASALWALDWTLRAASTGVKGLNFNNAFAACANDAQSQNPICAPNPKAANAGDVTAQAEYYGLLAASRLEGGRFVPTSVTSPDPLPNLTTWATLAPGGTVKIAIDNLATAGSAQPVSISTSGYTATEEPLVGSAAEARSGISLGGAQVTGSGRWRPRSVRLSHANHSFRVVVPPASAAIVTLHRTR